MFEGDHMTCGILQGLEEFASVLPPSKQWQHVPFHIDKFATCYDQPAMRPLAVHARLIIEIERSNQVGLVLEVGVPCSWGHIVALHASQRHGIFLAMLWNWLVKKKPAWAVATAAVTIRTNAKRNDRLGLVICADSKSKGHLIPARKSRLHGHGHSRRKLSGSVLQSTSKLEPEHDNVMYSIYSAA